jgi:hypothetical protein
LHVKKHIGFSGLRKILSERFAQCADRRSGPLYGLHDCLMSAFAMMFFQDPSLRQFQKRLEDAMNKNNLSTLFNVSDIPGDTQLRKAIDACDPKSIEEVFSDYFTLLQRGKQLDSFRVLDGYYLIPIDGTEYFSSEKIHCPQCLWKKSAKGKVRYHHQILQAAVVCPGQRQVIPLAPEPVQNSDGSQKQDCELNAGKRILSKIRKAHPKLRIIIGGDGLYSKQPFIEQLKSHHMSFVLVAKPDDHQTLFQWVDELRQMKETRVLTFTDAKKRLHRYEWAKAVPVNGSLKSELVDFFDYRLIVDGKTNYHNSWVTDIDTTENNVVELVKIGRARWKIENETFNTLKNQGYHIEHNFGHGRQNLSYNLFLLNLLAFFVHQILELSDRLYQRCRTEKFTSRREFWNQLRCTIRIIVFDHWEQLLLLILDPENNRPP